MDDARRRLRLMLAVIAIVAAFHIRHALNADSFVTADSPSYVNPARNIAERGAFVDRDPVAYSSPYGMFPAGPVRAVTLRTPLYPLVLAGFFEVGLGLRAVAIFQHALVVVFAACVFWFVAREIGEVAGVIAGLVYGVWPSVIDVAGVAMTETVAAVLVGVATAGFYRGVAAEGGGATLRIPRVAIAGVLFGVATLVRPITLYLPLVLVLVMLRRVKLAVVFAIASSLLPAMWMMRNKAATGVAVVSSIEGENLLLYRAAGTLIVKDMPPHRAIFALQRQFGFYHPVMQLRAQLVRDALARAERDGIPREQLTHARLSRYYQRMGLEIIARHPFAYAALSTSSAIALYFDHFPTWAARRGAHPAEARIRFVPLGVGLFALAVYGVLAIYRRNRDAGVILGTVLVYFTVVSAGPEVEERFIVPFCAIYATAIAAGADALIRWARGR